MKPEIENAKLALAGKSAHLMIILEGAIASYGDITNPLRLHNTGTALRELLREFLAGLAPDDQIKLASWFIPDPTSKTGITRRHRVYFSVYSFLESRHFDADLVSDIVEIADDLSNANSKLSALTHISAKTITPELSAAEELFRKSLGLFARLASAIISAETQIRSDLQESLHQSLSHLFSSAFFGSLDQLSTHTRPQDADGVELKTVEVRKDGVHFSGDGSVNCDMQFGSDGDCRRGDGIEWVDSFPFSFSGRSDLNSPFSPVVEAGDVEIDTDAYYE